MRKSSLFGRLAALLGLTATLAAPATAQRVVVFGDSLSDAGNASAITGGFAPGSPLGRFSNGLNWADIAFGSTPALGFSLGGGLTGNVTGYDNYAVGGAFTGSGNLVGLAVGIANEIAAFQGAGGTFAPRDLVSLWGGANNGFAAVQAPGATAATIQANAVSAVGAQLANVQTLVGLGARQILVLNVPDLGTTPAITAFGPSAVQGASYFTTVFNTGLQQGLTQIAGAAPGVNIIQADAASALRVLLANPALYGFTNTTTPCGFNGGAGCNGYLFGDGVHPTEATYAWLARYVGLLLDTAPAIASTAPLGEAGLWTSQLVTNAVFDRLDNWLSGAYAKRNGLFAELLGQYDTQDGGIGRPGYSLNLGGVRGGYDKTLGNVLFGGSAAFLQGKQSAPGFSDDITSLRADLYGTALMGPAFISLNGGIASAWYENIDRATGFPGVSAHGTTTGWIGSAAAEAGLMQALGPITLMPSGRITYVHSSVGGYSESAPILALAYDGRDSDAVLAGARLRVVTQLSGGGLLASLYGEVGYEELISYSASGISARLANNTALPVLVNPGEPNGPGILAKAGISTQLGQSIFLDVNYGATIHNGGGEAHSGNVRIKGTF